MRTRYIGILPIILALLSQSCPSGAVRCSSVHGKPPSASIFCTLLGKKASIGQIRGAVYKKNFVYDLLSVHMSSVQASHLEDTMSVMFWNVENFFDWRNDSTTVSDLEFSPAGERHWTWKRFQAKANAFAKALFWVEGETGRLPDIVGLEEVENAFVLRQLLQKTVLRKTDYKYVHYDSPDRRGIDVALLYRSSVLDLIDSKPCHLYDADTVMATRDILLCIFRRETPDSTAFAVLVNHHPSKYGGAAESEPRRRIAVERLRFLADSLAAIGIGRIVAGGDFNDTPDNPVFRLLEPSLMPTHMDLHCHGQGTIKYDGKWDLIDHIYVSSGWVFLPSAGLALPADRPVSTAPSPSLTPRMRILRIPFLLTRDNVHSGEKPLRTYTGPRHTGGVSDHLPVMVEVELPP